MQKIRLRPVRHEAPSCDDYGHPATVRAFEVATRVHRAHTEAFQIMPMGPTVDGTYRVSGQSGASYDVDIVSRSGDGDTCSCADFLGNDLGTCKHLEAVRRAIRGVAALRASFSRLGKAPSRPTVTVDAVSGLSFRLIGRAADGVLEARGWRRANRGSDRLLPIRTDAGRDRTNDEALRVVLAAGPALERTFARTWMSSRRRATNEAHAGGRLGVDVLRCTLFPYQREGVSHLVSSARALLADDMGLGKTAQAIAACEVLRRRGEASRVLIVTVASLKHQWQREIERFTGERAVVVGGSALQRRERLESDAPYKILNYEVTWRELSRLQALEADIVIYDEAQRAKNFRTKTAATLRAIPSRFAFILTGTPVENRLDDLFSLVQILDPSLLGPLWKFNLEFHEQNPKGRVIGYKNLGALRERIAPIVLRRRKEEVLTQLPPLTQQTRYTAMSKEQRELEEGYRASAAQLLALAEKRPLRPDEQNKLMGYLLKARQACSALELCDAKRKGSPKLDELEALIGEIAAQGTSKILVFSEWTEMLKLAAARLEAVGIGHVMLHGGVPVNRRPALLDHFRESSEVRVLLSTDAGGVGLNLQVATYVVHLDLPWNPGRLDQRTARAHRMGQTRGVSVTYLCSECGIEWGIEKTLGKKRAVQSAALDEASSVDSLEAPSFSVFLKQLRDVLETVSEPGDDIEMDGVGDGPAHGIEAELAALPAGPAVPSLLRPPEAGGDIVQTSAPSHRQVAFGAARAKERLRLARLVLQGGFSSDAVRAAYDGLATAIRGLLEGDRAAITEYAPLVAAIYRDLLPSGRLPAAAHLALAKLHDLAALEEHGVPLDGALAGLAVDEAAEWIERIAAREHETALPSLAAPGIAHIE